MAFMVLALSQVLHAFNMRSNRSLFKIGPFKNKKLNLAVLASVLLVLIVLFTPVGVAFGIIKLPLDLYFMGFGLILVPVIVMEIAKALKLVK